MTPCQTDLSSSCSAGYAARAMTVAAQRTKRRQHREETRQQILDAAQEFLREHSFRELSVDALMSRTGHTPDGLLPPLRRHPALVLDADRRGRRRAGRGRRGVGRRPRSVGPRRGARAAAPRSSTSTCATAPLVHAVAEAAHHDETVEEAYDAMVEGFIALTTEAIEARVDSGELAAARRARDRARARADAQRLPRRHARPASRHRSRARARRGRRRSGRERCSPPDERRGAGRPAPSAVAAPAAALWAGPWPAEDGGPRRTQQAHGLRGLAHQAGRAPRGHRRARRARRRRWSSCAIPARSTSCATRWAAGRSRIRSPPGSSASTR